MVPSARVRALVTVLMVVCMLMTLRQRTSHANDNLEKQVTTFVRSLCFDSRMFCVSV